MRFYDLLRRIGCRLLPTPAAERQIHLVDELLECIDRLQGHRDAAVDGAKNRGKDCLRFPLAHLRTADRKSTRLNSSHRCISYAVFCLKKKKKKKIMK